MTSPLHPYTEGAVLGHSDPGSRRSGGERIVLQGSIPSPANPPKGCKFHTRCPYATDRCNEEAPRTA